MAGRLLLALDGSTDVCSAALLSAPSHAWVSRGPTAGPPTKGTWQVVDESSASDGKAQARVLLHLVDEMLRGQGAVAADLACIVVGTGPGTFTGVRITVATARALALALSVPVIGVSSLAALAAEAASAVPATSADAVCADMRDCLPSVIIPVIDARRGQVFFGVYIRGADAGKPSWKREAGFNVCDRQRLGSVCESAGAGTKDGVMVVGDASLYEGSGLPVRGEGVRPAFEIEFHPRTVAASRLVVGQEHLSEPDPHGGSELPACLARMLSGRSTPAEAGAAGSPEAVKPIYVRPPDADIHITKMRDPWKAR
jgi:tRNA threonylcarbamoyl adenosine modification protein YeaZ